MPRFQITNIQRRDVTGRLIGLAPDIIVECEQADIDLIGAVVRDKIGGAGYPSFSYEEIV